MLSNSSVSNQTCKKGGDEFEMGGIGVKLSCTKVWWGFVIRCWSRDAGADDDDDSLKLDKLAFMYQGLENTGRRW